MKTFSGTYKMWGSRSLGTRRWWAFLHSHTFLCLIEQTTKYSKHTHTHHLHYSKQNQSCSIWQRTTILTNSLGDIDRFLLWVQPSGKKEKEIRITLMFHHGHFYTLTLHSPNSTVPFLFSRVPVRMVPLHFQLLLNGREWSFPN